MRIRNRQVEIQVICGTPDEARTSLRERYRSLGFHCFAVLRFIGMKEERKTHQNEQDAVREELVTLNPGILGIRMILVIDFI